MVSEELFDNLPGELGMRTALSRGYYGLFHSAYAVLLSVNDVAAGVRLKHGTVSGLVRRRLGSAVGQVYEDALSARREADYEHMARFSPISVSRQLKLIRTHVHWFCLEASKVLK
jgi:uncharacterized protein (UPF0332 family)